MIKDFSGNNKWAEMKRGLGVTPETDAAFEAAWDRIDERVCLDFDVDDLTDIIRSIPGITIPQGYSMLDDFVNRFEYPSVELQSIALLGFCSGIRDHRKERCKE